MKNERVKIVFMTLHQEEGRLFSFSVVRHGVVVIGNQAYSHHLLC